MPACRIHSPVAAPLHGRTLRSRTAWRHVVSSKVLIALLVVGNPLHAATLTWPGAAPCNSTLQSCISAAAPGDVIEIESNDPIDEDLDISDKSLTLRNATGFAPRLADGRSITSDSSVSGTIVISLRGITMRDGRVYLQRSGVGNADFRVSRMRLESTTNSADTGIQIAASNSGNLDVSITHNHVDAGSSGQIWPGIDIQSLGPVSVGHIAYNRVVAPRGSLSKGIRAYTAVGGSLQVVVFANEVRGHFNRGAIDVRTLTGPIFADVINNVVVGARSAGTSDDEDGITLTVRDDAMAAFVYNNTVVDTGGGVLLSRAVGSSQSLNGTVRNNLIAFNENGLRMLAGSEGTDNARNLVHGNQANSFTPGTGTLTEDPRLISLSDPRLLANSPAINSGDANGLDLNLDLIDWPHVDAAGRRRFIGSGSLAVDIGAYEFGDTFFLTRSPQVPFNHFPIEHPSLNLQPDARPQLTKVFSPFGLPQVVNPHPIGAWFASGQWRAFNQDSAQMPTGAAFNVMAPGPEGVGGARYAHVAVAANTSGHATSLDHPYLNTTKDAILIVTPNWDNNVYVNHNIAAGNSCLGPPGPDCWVILTQDFAAMPMNASFNVYAQDPSHNAFVHTASAANSGGNSTRLDHPLLNGNPCARLLITPKIGAVNDHPIDLFYEPFDQRWRIFNQGGGSRPVPVGAEFFVVVDAASAGPCTTTLFVNGFEATTPSS